MSIFPDRRRPPFAPELLLRVALAWVMICGLLIVTNLGAIMAQRFPDPDDVMRLLEVRDLLAGQSWFDVTQFRVDAISGGVHMHWSRLVDIPLVAVIGFCSLFMSQHVAESVALVLVPLITFGCALLLAGRIAWRLISEEVAGLACLAMALSVPLILQMRPMRIDHHGWQIVLALAAVNGLMARNPRTGGWVTGFSIAAWLAISVEGLPMGAALCGIAALRWLRDRRGREWFVNVMVSLGVSSLAIFLSTRGLTDLAEHCDAISPVHLALFAWGGLAAWALSRFEPMPRSALVAGFGLIAAGAGAIIYSIAPQCAGGGFVALDPLVTHYWYSSVGEGLPVWDQSASLALQVIIPPLIALMATLNLAANSRDWLRQWWHEYALLLAASLLLTVFVVRAGAVSGALAAVPLGWQLSQWVRTARNMRQPGKRVLALAGVVIALLPAFPLTVLTMAMPARASASALQLAGTQCDIPRSSDILATLPEGEIFAPLDIGPQLLYQTRDTVIATGHHRGNNGMRAVIEMFIGSPASAYAELKARGTRYLVLCPDLVEPSRYADAAPDGLMAQLLKGREPDWLEPVPVPGPGNMKVWIIRS